MSRDLPIGPRDRNAGLTIMRYWQVDNLVGRLLTYIDATYADREQREAQKDIVRSTVYGWYREQQWNDSYSEELEKLLGTLDKKLFKNTKAKKTIYK